MQNHILRQQSCHRCGGSGSTPLVRRPVVPGTWNVAWITAEVGVLSGVVEEWQSHVAEPVVRLEAGVRTLSVSGTFRFDACEMFAADVGELEHAGVSKISHVVDMLGRVNDLQGAGKPW